MNFKTRIKVIIGMAYLKIKYPKISFILINNLSDLKKMYDLIWEVYALEKKYINTNCYSQEVIIDEFEENAIKIGAFSNNGEIIGTLRIILNSPRSFYVEKDFNVDLSKFPKNEIAELSRLIVRSDYRNKLISLGLLKKGFEECRKRKIKYWVVVIPKEIKNYYQNFLGIKFYALKTKPLTKEQLKVREKMKNYYIMTNPVPYLINLDEI